MKLTVFLFPTTIPKFTTKLDENVLKKTVN